MSPRTSRALPVALLTLTLATGLVGTTTAPAQETPTTEQDCLARGHSLLSEGEPAAAVTSLLEAVERFPESRNLLRLLATAHWSAGESEKSLDVMARQAELAAVSRLERLLARDGDELATTAQEVIDRHLEAIGGRDAVAGVETMVLEYTANSTTGTMATIRRQFKRPGWFRQEVLGGPSHMVTDGETVWRVRDSMRQPVDDPGYLMISSIDDFFLDPAGGGVTYEFVGPEIFSNTPVYRLVRTFSGGQVQDLFFSIAQGYLTEIRSAYPVGHPYMESTLSLWDYRDVGGISIPHVFIRNVGPMGSPHGGVVQRVEVNAPLEDAVFTGGS